MLNGAADPADRRRLRRRMRTARRNLTVATQARSSARVLARLSRLPALRHARRLACYLPIPGEGEIDLRPLIEQCLDRRMAVYLPVVTTTRASLRFVRLHPWTLLIESAYGIAEPAGGAVERLPPEALDVVLAPLVAFDADCNRLGMGAGLYDRSFAFLNERRHWRRPQLIGVAHDFQRVAAIRPAEWDVALSAVVTERATYRRKPHPPRGADR